MSDCVFQSETTALLQRSNMLVVATDVFRAAGLTIYSHCVQQISDKLARLVRLGLPRFRSACRNLRNRGTHGGLGASEISRTGAWMDRLGLRKP